MILLGLAAICAVMYVALRRRDRRMLRNGVLLLGAVFFGVLGVVDLTAHRFPAVEIVIAGGILVSPLVLLVLAGFLLANGVRMFRREGRSLGNMLSFVAGVAIVLLIVATLVVLRLNSTLVGTVFFLPLALAGYFGLVFVVFLLYALVYGRLRFPPGVDAIVVLGSGLVRGQVPPLLRSRLDKAVDVYRGSVATGVTPLVIPSGGQGADESRAEGAAMEEYLIAAGLPQAHVRAETRSRNTRENLEMSRVVQEDAGVSGRVLVVTNNYHVMRAAMLARDIGSPAQVVGSPTARYYVPSAFLREFLAVVAAHRVAHGVVLVGIVAVWVVTLVSAFASR